MYEYSYVLGMLRANAADLERRALSGEKQRIARMVTERTLRNRALAIIPSPRERDSHAGDSQGEGNMIHRGKREGVCHGGCGSSSQGLRGRANTRAGEAV